MRSSENMTVTVVSVPSSPIIDVTGILTTLVSAKVFLRLSRFNYETIEVLYTPQVIKVLARIVIKEQQLC